MADSSEPLDPYDTLPSAFKEWVSRHEYDWMSDDQKAQIGQDFTEPEY
jgi:hypothetical protein